MNTPSTLLLAGVVLAAGTFAFRAAGPALRARVGLSPRVEKLVTVTVAVLFAALVATATLLRGHHLAGVARPTGVAVAGVLAYRRAPFVVVVLAAVAITAGLRLLGLP